MRNLALLTIAALASSVFFSGGCAGSSEGGVTLNFWAMGTEGEQVQGLVREFERSHPDVHVIVQQIPWIAAHEKLLTAFAGNSSPDICQLGDTWIPEFATLNAIEPLGAYVDTSKQIHPEIYFPGVWAMNFFDSTLYGVPWYVDTRVMFYRKDILAAAGFPNGPKSWAQWKTACDRIIHNGSTQKHYAVFLPTNEWVPAIVLGLEEGSQLLKDHNTYGDFEGEKFATAFAFLRSFYEQGYAPTSMTEVSNVYQGMADGFFAMYITGPWNVGEFKRRMPADMQDKWMTAPMPGLRQDTPGVSFPGGSSFAIFRSSQHKKEAWELAEYLSSVKSQVEFYRRTGNLPAVREAWKDSLLQSDPHMKAFFLQLFSLEPLPRIPEWEQIAQKAQDYVQMAAIESKPTAEILRSLDHDVNDMLEKRRWLLNQNH